MRRVLVTLLLILVSFLLQSTLLHQLSLGGIIPNLMLILTVSIAFMRGDKAGMLVGFACGLLADIFFGSILGFMALIYMLLGFVSGQFHRGFYPQNIALPLSLIVVSDLAYGFVCYVLMFLFRTRFHLGFYMTHVILPELVYTTVAGILVYPLLLWIHTLLAGIEQRSARKFV